MHTTLAERARALRAEALTVYFVARHRCTPWYAKLMAACVAAYAFSPIDLIPDPIPIVGLLDDLIVVPLGVVLVLKLVPADVLVECQIKARAVAAAPTSWVGAAIVLGVWVALGVLGFAIVRRLFRS